MRAISGSFLAVASAIALWLSVAEAGWFGSPKDQIVTPNKNTPWYMGHDTTIAPFTMKIHPKGKAGRFDTGDYRLVLYRDKMINRRVLEIHYDAPSLKNLNGYVNANFDASTNEQFMNDPMKYHKVVSKHIRDGRNYRLKLVFKKGRFGWKTLAKSEKFKIFRIGGQDGIPNKYQYVKDVITPAENKNVPLEKNTMDVVFTIQHFIAGKRMRIELVNALTGEKTRTFTEVAGEDAMVEEAKAKLDIAKIAPGRYFLEFYTRCGLTNMFRKKMIFRSAPFHLVRGDHRSSNFQQIPPADAVAEEAFLEAQELRKVDEDDEEPMEMLPSPIVNERTAPTVRLPILDPAASRAPSGNMDMHSAFREYSTEGFDEEEEDMRRNHYGPQLDTRRRSNTQ